MKHFFAVFSISLGFSSRLFSQDAEEPAIPGVEPPAPRPPGVAARDDEGALGKTLIRENLEYLALSGDDLADLYRQYTGRRVIVSSAASQAEFRFVQPASPQNPLTYDKAAELLRKAATIENFIFVPDATDPNLDFLTLATAGIKPTGRGISVYTENDPLPEGDAVISYVMPLDYVKPDEAVRTFTQIVGQFGAYGSIAAVPNAASVVITENTSLVRKLIDLKAEIDKPSSQVATRFITVRYADVTELATTLNDLLGSQQQNNRTAGVQRTRQGGGQAAQAQVPGVNPGAAGAAQGDAAGGGGSGEETPVQIVPDARTNRIFAMGRPVDLVFVEGLVREFDTESDQRNFLRRELKFLAVSDFLPIAADALTRAFSGTGTGAEGGRGQSTRNQSSRNQTNRKSNFSNRGNNTRNNRGNNSGLGGSGSEGGSSLSDPQVNSAPESLLIGRTQLVADNITNSIVVQGPPSGVEIVEKLLDQLDVKADQVMISTVFGQLTLGDSTTTGVDWLRAFRGNDDGGLAFSNITGGQNTGIDPTGLIDPITGTAAGTFPNQTGLSLYGKIGSSLGAFVNLLSSSNDFTVLSRPSIFTANNRLGTITSGRRIPVPTNSNQFGAGGVSTNIEFRDVVLRLEVIPLVNSEDEITLQIALISDDVVGQSDFIEGIGQIPIIGTRELLTTVTVPNNQTIILGGLITTSENESVTGIPILSDIPGLGRLFSSKNNTIDRDELMIFMQPSIVNSDTIGRVQADMDSRYNVSGEARRFSDGDGGVLPPVELPEGKGGESGIPVAIPVEEPVRNFNRDSLRPIHRRW